MKTNSKVKIAKTKAQLKAMDLPSNKKGDRIESVFGDIVFTKEGISVREEPKDGRKPVVLRPKNA